VLDAVDIVEIAAQHPAPSYLVPCGGSQIALGVPVEYLDTRPAQQPGWLLIGCEQSRRLYKHFYGHNPTRVDICPMHRIDRADPRLGVAKCCLIDKGIRVVGNSAVVGWGASRDDIRQALRVITGLQSAPASAFAPIDTADPQAQAPKQVEVQTAVKC